MRGRLHVIRTAEPTVFRYCCAREMQIPPAAPAKRLQRFESLRLLWRRDSVCRNEFVGIRLVQNTRMVHDHGSEFCNAELRAVIKAHDLIDIRTRARHPESNGIVERWNDTVRRESEDYHGDNYLVAQRKAQRLLDEYNNVRLHKDSSPETQASDERTAPTSYNPHDINEEPEAAAKWPHNQARSL